MFDEPKYPELDPNKKSAPQLWEERYATDNYLFGKEPVLLLKNHVGHLKKGKALDLAMGEGRNAAFLAKEGFAVEGVDCSAKAIDKAKKLATEKGVTYDAKVQNLDFFILPLMKYDTVIMTYLKPLSRVISEIRRGLVAGGTVAIEGYTTEHARAHPNNPLVDLDQCWKPGELIGVLKEFQILFYSELPQGDAHTVQVIARKNQK